MRNEAGEVDAWVRSWNGRSWVLSYRIDLKDGREPLKESSRRGTCHNQSFMYQKDHFGNCEADGLEGRARN